MEESQKKKKVAVKTKRTWQKQREYGRNQENTEVAK